MLVANPERAEAGIVTAASPDPEMVTPADTTLMNEHGVLLRLLLIYNEALRQVTDDRTRALEALQRAADLVHQVIENFHEALEEGYVFPVLRRHGTLSATVDILLLQHARGRLITQLLLADARPSSWRHSAAQERVRSATAAFVRMYLPHEAREDTVIFPAYREACSPERLQADSDTFDQLASEAFGSNPLGTVVGWVEEIERSLGIYSLSDFTAAPVAPVADPAD